MRLWTIFAVLAASCSDYELTKRGTGDVFYQEQPGAVDILLVVDNSCSMQPYQEELANNFDAFLTYFIQGDVDYQIGVTTTTMTEAQVNSAAGCTQTDVNRIPSPGELIDNVIINQDTANASEIFDDIVNVGICGAGTEMGLEAGLKVLENQNSTLLRDEAYLSVIFVSDEEDASPMPVNNYINAMRAVKDATAREVFNASSLVVTDINSCNANQVNSGATFGSRYVDVSDQSGGIQVNICSDDFGNIVNELGLNSSRLNDVFFLSSYPDLSTLIVNLERSSEDPDEAFLLEDVPCNHQDYPWSYEIFEGASGPEPVIRFQRESLPPTNTRISVEYNQGGAPVDPDLLTCSEAGDIELSE